MESLSTQKTSRMNQKLVPPTTTGQTETPRDLKAKLPVIINRHKELDDRDCQLSWTPDRLTHAAKHWPQIAATVQSPNLESWVVDCCKAPATEKSSYLFLFLPSRDRYYILRPRILTRYGSQSLVGDFLVFAKDDLQLKLVTGFIVADYRIAAELKRCLTFKEELPDPEIRALIANCRETPAVSAAEEEEVPPLPAESEAVKAPVLANQKSVGPTRDVELLLRRLTQLEKDLIQLNVHAEAFFSAVEALEVIADELQRDDRDENKDKWFQAMMAFSSKYHSFTLNRGDPESVEKIFAGFYGLETAAKEIHEDPSSSKDDILGARLALFQEEWELSVQTFMQRFADSAKLLEPEVTRIGNMFKFMTKKIQEMQPENPLTTRKIAREGLKLTMTELLKYYPPIPEVSVDSETIACEQNRHQSFQGALLNTKGFKYLSRDQQNCVELVLNLENLSLECTAIGLQAHALNRAEDRADLVRLINQIEKDLSDNIKLLKPFKKAKFKIPPELSTEFQTMSSQLKVSFDEATLSYETKFSLTHTRHDLSNDILKIRRLFANFQSIL